MRRLRRDVVQFRDGYFIPRLGRPDDNTPGHGHENSFNWRDFAFEEADKVQNLLLTAAGKSHLGHMGYDNEEQWLCKFLWTAHNHRKETACLR